MLRCIAACCLAATLALAGLGITGEARAQDAAADVGQPPSADDTMAAYRAVETLVRTWTMGDGPKPEFPSCAAAGVTLRMDGEVYGRGVAMGEKCIATATLQAMEEAEPKFGIPRDALYQDTLVSLARRVTISLQLAGDLVPVTVKDAADAVSAIAPGLEGAGVRLGDRTAVMFPERMLTMGTEPAAALASLVARLADDPSLAVVPLSMLAKQHGAVYYRFKVSHLAQPWGGGDPQFLSRCGRVVRDSDIDTAELERWAQELAHRLGKSAGPWSKWMTASYDPIRGKLIDGTQDDAQMLIGALALARYARMERVARSDREQADLASHCLVDQVLSLHTNPDQPRLDPRESAVLHIWSVSGVPLRDLSRDPAWKERMLLPARDFVLEQSRVQDAKDSPVVLGLLAAAVGEGLGDPLYAEQLVRDAMMRIPAGTLASAMPWLGWAELKNHPSGAVPSAAALRDMRDQLWKHQLRPEDLPPEQQDLAGGIVFTRGNSPMPTWQMARPLAFVATMLRDPRLTEDKEVSQELLHLLASLRFLRQLTVREGETFMYRLDDMVGGVRSSLWDQRMPMEATAMTLMAVCETLKSLDEIQKQANK